MSALVFGPDLPLVRIARLTDSVPPASISFFPEPAWIEITLLAARNRRYGMLSGAEGQGSELVFMDDGRLGELVLDFRPLEGVKILDSLLVDALRIGIDVRRTPGDIFLDTHTTAALVPDLVALSPSLDLAVFSFCGWMEMDSDKWREELDELRLVEVASGITLGLSCGGHVAWIAVEAFLQRQQVLSFVIDEGLHAGAALASLNELHRIFYLSPTSAEFEYIYAAIRGHLSTWLLADADFMTAFDRVAHSYVSELQMKRAKRAKR